MKNSNKPTHYDVVENAFKVYRASRNASVFHTLNGMVSEASKDEVDPYVEEATKIVRMVDNAIIRINFLCNNGDKISTILYYRYMAAKTYSEEEIMHILANKGMQVSIATYYRLREQGIQAACKFIWNDAINDGIVKDIDLKQMIPSN